ncbi:MAG: hypothetical protein IPJ82_01610 [Lewinellaceae bacterium]|nr:hypothetical protein [Lewinellaceae bacterium]
MFGFIKKLIGTKQDRDMKQYQSLVAEINHYFEEFQGLSNDELRSKSLDFRTRIKEYLKDADAEVASINRQAIDAEDFNEKERLFKEVDELRKDRDKSLEDILLAILPEAFAVVKETSRRFSKNETITVTATDHDRSLAAQTGKTYVSIEGDKAVWKNKWMAAGGEIVWNMVHYDVQLIGGMVLHDGKIAEMATGEGKTLVATLPAYLNGVAGEGVHIVTVNDYLARRDSEWVGPIYEFLMLTVDCIDKYRPHSKERIDAYRCDITFGTNSEFGFDYLRDNMVINVDELVQRKHHYAIVDEVDSVLIDDARTPLIISGPVTRGAEDQEFVELNPTVKKLMEEQGETRRPVPDGSQKTFCGRETGPRRRPGRSSLVARTPRTAQKPRIGQISQRRRGQSAASKIGKQLPAGKQQTYARSGPRAAVHHRRKKPLGRTDGQRGGIPVELQQRRRVFYHARYRFGTGQDRSRRITEPRRKNRGKRTPLAGLRHKKPPHPRDSATVESVQPV